DEALDVDRPARLDRHRVEVLVREDDVAVLLHLESLDDMLEGDLLAVLLADALVTDPAAVLVVELVELQPLLLGRRVDRNRDRHEAEGDGPFPHGSWHRSPPWDGPHAAGTVSVAAADDTAAARSCPRRSAETPQAEPA